MCCFGCELAINPGGGGTPIMVYRGRQQAKGVSFFRLQVYERVGISLVEVHVYERVSRVQRKSVLQSATREICSQHVLAHKLFQLAPKPFFISRIEYNHSVI